VTLAWSDAEAAGIDPVLFVRQIEVESRFDPQAVSPAGAVGIAQFLPQTAARLGVNPTDPVSALWGAAHYMAELVRFYGGDEARALAAYNAGPGAVAAAIEAGGTSWRAAMPQETQQYLAAILPGVPLPGAPGG
jgi:soluble lytic murein transglycosylase-like protein